MKQSDANRLAKNLVVKFGLGVIAVVTSNDDGQHVVIQPSEIHPNEGFVIDVLVGWRSLNIDFIPGKFAADLLSQMSTASAQKKQIFAEVARHIAEDKGVIVFKVNGKDYDPFQPSLWPTDWKALSFSLRKSPLEVNTDDRGLTEQLINTWVERFFACVLSIAPLEGVDESDDEVFGLPEGALKVAVVNRYERSRFNRSICLNFHGATCKVCQMNFEKVYGQIGIGFIHVHHVIRVSRLGENYIINPIEDLVPVCPNCHAMLHKQDPPYSVNELKEILQIQKSN